MEITTLRQFKELVKWAKDQGVVHFKIGNIEVNIDPNQEDRKEVSKKIKAIFDPESIQYSEEKEEVSDEIKYWSAGGN